MKAAKQSRINPARDSLLVLKLLYRRVLAYHLNLLTVLKYFHRVLLFIGRGRQMQEFFGFETCSR